MSEGERKVRHYHKKDNNTGRRRREGVWALELHSETGFSTLQLRLIKLIE